MTNKMNRVGFIKSIFGIPAVVMAAGASDEKIRVPKWIVDRFKEDHQNIPSEMAYHDSEYLFPENDHTKILVSKSFFYPWIPREVYAGYKGDMYFFLIDPKFKKPRHGLLPHYSK